MRPNRHAEPGRIDRRQNCHINILASRCLYRLRRRLLGFGSHRIAIAPQRARRQVRRIGQGCCERLISGDQRQRQPNSGQRFGRIWASHDAMRRHCRAPIRGKIKAAGAPTPISSSGKSRARFSETDQGKFARHSGSMFMARGKMPIE